MRACGNNNVRTRITGVSDEETHLTGDCLWGVANVCLEAVRLLPAGRLATRGILGGLRRGKGSESQRAIGPATFHLPVKHDRSAFVAPQS